MTGSNSASSNGHTPTERQKLLTELVILSSILVVLSILAFRPFGFRTFLIALGHDNIFSLSLVVGAIAVLLVIMQRIGLIFPDKVKEYNTSNP